MTAKIFPHLALDAVTDYRAGRCLACNRNAEPRVPGFIAGGIHAKTGVHRPQPGFENAIEFRRGAQSCFGGEPSLGRL